MLLACTELTFPGLNLERGANLHLSRQEHLEPTEAEREGEEDFGWVMWACVGGMGPGHRGKTLQRLWFGRSSE